MIPHPHTDTTGEITLSLSTEARRNYASLRSNPNMDRQQAIALFFAFLMVSSMVAWGVSFL
ncbi:MULTISPECIES: hypothetical protein [Haloferacaceae]|uniref:Uncharacterized protein n=1 Tax=Halorubrum glutamatedens TaxID=2707018 RepID=A0ABD5QRI7_9EURY|nr:hypothetical protein [Halobellus captivus]